MENLLFTYFENLKYDARKIFLFWTIIGLIFLALFFINPTTNAQKHHKNDRIFEPPAQAYAEKIWNEFLTEQLTIELKNKKEIQ